MKIEKLKYYNKAQTVCLEKISYQESSGNYVAWVYFTDSQYQNHVAAKKEAETLLNAYLERFGRVCTILSKETFVHSNNKTIGVVFKEH